MTKLDVAPNFGAELKDGFKPVNAWVGNGIAWLDDIQQFYRERSAIEKEYSQKLGALAKKYFEKKTRKSSTLSVGDTPTVTPGSLESASMTTWTVQLTTLESRAAEHDRFSNQLIVSLADPLKALGAKYEDLRKQHAEYAAKLEKERDGTYADLRKTKGKYDGVCQEVENRRKKVDGSHDHGKTKAQGAYSQQHSEMRNAKNTYLISINVTNKQKERYYHEYVPDLLDSLQALSETRVSALNNLWTTASSLETQTMNRSTQLLEHQTSEIPRNDPALDSMMFVRHNVSPWQDPADFVFEPSPVWHDDDTMAKDSTSKTFLMNILSKSKTSLNELRRECEGKRREVEAVKRVRQAVREGKDNREEGEVVRALFHNQESLYDSERRRVTAEVEVSTILAAVGDISIGARNHTFKSQTYKIPTNCDLCSERLWGLSAKGMTCEECGFTCHSKCELKVSPDCPGELTKEQKKAIKVERQAVAQTQTSVVPPPSNDEGHTNGAVAHTIPQLQRSDTVGSMNTLSSGYATSAHRSVTGLAVKSSEDISSSTTVSTSSPSAAPGPTRHRIMAPPPTQYASPPANGGDNASGAKSGKMLYAYQAGGDGEISISEGETFTLLEPDDGSGWIKIKPANFGATSGLVPATYADIAPDEEASTRPTSFAPTSSTASLSDSSPAKGKRQGPAVAPRRGAKKSPLVSATSPGVKHVLALYTYSANGPGEVDMQEGERMVLVAPDSGDGWVEVEARAGKGVVPAGWIKDA